MFEFDKDELCNRLTSSASDDHQLPKMSRITLRRDNSSGCFRLQSHGKVPASVLSSMYDNDNSLSDVRLTGATPTSGACDSRPIRAHKAILAHASPHLRDLFVAHGYVDSNKPAYTFTTIDHDSLRSIMEFIYTDNVDVDENGATGRVRGILIGAKYLIMKELAEACENFLASSDQIGVQDCIDMFQFAFKYKCTVLLSTVCEFIAKNLLAVSQSAKFLGLTQDECAKFLLSEPVVAANADDRCRAAIAWLNHESPSRAESAECIMSMAALDAAGVASETLLLAAQSAVIRPTIKGICLALIDAMASNIRHTSQLISEQKGNIQGKARGEAWYMVGSFNDRKAFYRYDVTRREWSTLPDLPWTREFAGVCAVNERLFVMGGVKCGRLTVTIDEYDTTTQTWSTGKAKLSCERNLAAVAADSTYAYAFGGCGDDGKTLGVTERYSAGSDTVEKLTDINNKRFQATAVCKNDGMVFVVGGITERRRNNKGVGHKYIDKYDHVTRTWSEVARLKHVRFSLGAAFLGDDLYMAGGCPSTKVEILNTETGRMRLCAAALGRVRAGCSAAPLDQHVLCVLGGSLDNVQELSSSVETYDTREGKWTVGVVVPDLPEANAYFGFARVGL